MAPQVMGRVVPGEVAAMMARAPRGGRRRPAMRRRRRGASRDDGDCTRVHLTDGTAIDGDVVVAGVGAVPNTELAAARPASPSTTASPSTSHLRTSDPAIFAAGDCCSFPHPFYGGRRIRLEAWRNAHDQATRGGAEQPARESRTRSCRGSGRTSSTSASRSPGCPTRRADDVVRVRADGTVLRFGLDGSGRLVAACGVAAGTAIAKDIRLAEMLIAKRATPDPDSSGRSIRHPEEPVDGLIRDT